MAPNGAPKEDIAPLQINWGDHSTLYTVTGLAHCLMHGFPDLGRGNANETALLVCHTVLMGGEDDVPEQAREAFVDAAHDAGLTIFPDDDINLLF